MAPPWRVESEKRFRLISVSAICDLEWQNIVSIQKTQLFSAYAFESLESDIQKVWNNLWVSQEKSLCAKKVLKTVHKNIEFRDLFPNF